MLFENFSKHPNLSRNARSNAECFKQSWLVTWELSDTLSQSKIQGVEEEGFACSRGSSRPFVMVMFNQMHSPRRRVVSLCSALTRFLARMHPRSRIYPFNEIHDAVGAGARSPGSTQPAVILWKFHSWTSQ